MNDNDPSLNEQCEYCCCVITEENDTYDQFDAYCTVCNAYFIQKRPLCKDCVTKLTEVHDLNHKSIDII